jgi:hypothetical protein
MWDYLPAPAGRFAPGKNVRDRGPTLVFQMKSGCFIDEKQLFTNVPAILRQKNIQFYG